MFALVPATARPLVSKAHNRRDIIVIIVNRRSNGCGDRVGVGGVGGGDSCGGCGIVGGGGGGCGDVNGGCGGGGGALVNVRLAF